MQENNLALNIFQNRDLAALIVAFVALVTGAIVMVGWVTDIQIVKSIAPTWATMKFTTALCFFLSGAVLYNIVDEPPGSEELSHFVLSVATLAILVLMGAQFGSVLAGVESGIEEIFIREPEGFLRTTVASAPSTGTMSGFTLIALAGLLRMSNVRRLTLWLGLIGWATILVGSSAVVGYITETPALYYAYESIITAMAMHTGLLFVALGAGLVLSARHHKSGS